MQSLVWYLLQRKRRKGVRALVTGCPSLGYSVQVLVQKPGLGNLT